MSRSTMPIILWEKYYMSIKTLIKLSPLYLMGAFTYAQDITPTTNTDAGAKDVEVIMVTATRRSENIQDVPISMTQMSGDFLERSGLKNIDDVATMVPNFLIGKSSQSNNVRMTIRGVGSVGNAAIESSVGVFIDGVYYARPGSVIGNLVALESIEVLRGPQGTLFGRNTPMGALNINTLDPTNDPMAKISFGVGDYGAITGTGVFSGALTDTVSGLISVNYSTRDGYGFNEYDDTEIGDRTETGVRGKLNFDLSDKLNILISADTNSTEHTGEVVEILESSNTPVFQGTTAALLGTAANTGNSYDGIVNQYNDDEVEDSQWGVSAEITYKMGDYELKSITALREWDNDYLKEGALRLPANLLPRNTFTTNTSTSQELQILSPEDDTFEYVAGLYFYSEDYDIDQNFDTGTAYCSPVAFAVIRGQLIAGGMDPATATATAQGQAAACGSFQQDAGTASVFNQELSSTAVFFQGTYHVNPKLDATFGIRYSSDEKTGYFEEVLANPFLGLVRAAESIDMAFEDDKVTYLANLRYKMSDDTMVFANVSTGFKSGGFNSQGGGTALLERRVFGSETTTNYELGLKGNYMEGNFSTNVTLYRTDIADFQDRSFDGLSFITSNAGELRQQGLEVDFKATPTDNLAIYGGYSFLDSAFLSYPGASPLPGNTGVQDLTGRPNHRSPKHQGNLTFDYSVEMDGKYTLFVRPSLSYMGEHYQGGDTNLNTQTIQAGYSIINLSTGIENYDAGWRVEAYVNNLADKGYCTGMYDQPLGSQLGAINAANNTVVLRCVVGTPRTAGVRFSYTY
jgi:iron complex outermembrane recepter protein